MDFGPDKPVSGILEIGPNRFGFLRNVGNGLRPNPMDPKLPEQFRTAFRLRGGEWVDGTARATSKTERNAAELFEIHKISGIAAADYTEVATTFEDATAVDPQKRIRFETAGGPLSMRVVDLLTPIGFGQRGLIVASPRTGKTVLLQHMAHGISENHPNAHLIALLIDERPEEVTHFQRSTKAEVIASSNDQDTLSHMRLARLMIERAKRLVEVGRDVIMLLDSLTRLGRAFNAGIRDSGRIMSGGLDVRALTEPKAIFGAARKIEDGGSLTIIATALIDTGSRMDEVIFNEFKGTGNMEIVLSRALSDRRIWPAIDLPASGTRKEELLLTPQELKVAHEVRRRFVSADPPRAMEQLLEALGKFPSNAEFIAKFSDRVLPAMRTPMRRDD